MSHAVQITREQDDPLGVLRASVGGTPALGYYLVYRGDPDAVVAMLRVVLKAAEAYATAQRVS